MRFRKSGFDKTGLQYYLQVREGHHPAMVDQSLRAIDRDEPRKCHENGFPTPMRSHRASCKERLAFLPVHTMRIK